MKPKYIQESFLNFSKDAMTSEQMGHVVGGSGCICFKNGFVINDRCVCFHNAFRAWGGKLDFRNPDDFL